MSSYGKTSKKRAEKGEDNTWWPARYQKRRGLDAVFASVRCVFTRLWEHVARRRRLICDEFDTRAAKWEVLFRWCGVVFLYKQDFVWATKTTIMELLRRMKEATPPTPLNREATPTGSFVQS